MSTRATRSGERIAIYLVEGTGCGGCALEVQAALAARYGAVRRRIFAVETPAHADVLVVCGVLPEALREEVAGLVSALPEPCACVQLGDCAVEGVVVEGAAAVAGCPPGPEDILMGIATAWRSGQPCRLAAEPAEGASP